MEIKGEKVDFKKLRIPDQEVFRLLGYKNSIIPDKILVLYKNVLKQSFSYCRPVLSYGRTDRESVAVKNDFFLIDNLKFDCGEKIANPLRGIERMIFFAASLGKEYDDWSKSLINGGELLLGYMADCIGSVLVETVLDQFGKKLNIRMSDLGLSCSNRYSPGYCGWNVIEQHKIFSLLPENFAGITLTESALMIPLKSVSGIIGFGERIKKRGYSCAGCTEDNCAYLRDF